MCIGIESVNQYILASACLRARHSSSSTTYRSGLGAEGAVYERGAGFGRDSANSDVLQTCVVSIQTCTHARQQPNSLALGRAACVTQDLSHSWLTLVGLVEGDDAVVVAVEERHVLLQLRHAVAGCRGDARSRRAVITMPGPFSIHRSE
jgi:hypothetical protein